MCLMIDNPGGHEECGLKRCVVEDVEHSCHGTECCASAQQHCYQAKMADRRKRQQCLQIMLVERNHGAKHHGNKAGGGHDHEPFRRSGQSWPHPGHQKDAGLHHCC